MSLSSINFTYDEKLVKMVQYVKTLSRFLSLKKRFLSYGALENDRYRRIFITALTEVGAKGINIFTALISVPLTLHYLGTERYGMWLTISSLITILQFTDFGLGNGVLNAIAEANGKDDHELALIYVSSGFYLLVIIAVSLAGVGLFFYSYINWPAIFNVTTKEAMYEAGPATLIYLLCFLIGLPLGIVQRIHLGYQEGFLNSLWTGIGSLCSLLSLFVIVQLRAGLPWLALAMAGIPLAANLLNGLWLFTIRRPWLWPRISHIRKDAVKKILRLGIMFFALQIAIALAFSSDNIIATHTLGPEAVPEYAVPMRLFSTILILIGILQQPFWPAYGEAFARRDQIWIKYTFLRSFQISIVLAIIPASIIFFFGKQIIHWWVGSQITPSFFLLLGFAVWTILSAIGNAQAMFLNGAGIIKLQAICALMMAISAVMTKFFLAYSLGVAGIIWGTVLSYALFTSIPMTIYIPIVLKKMQLEVSINTN